LFEYIIGETTMTFQTLRRLAAEPAEDFHLMHIERKRIVVIQTDGMCIVGEVDERLIQTSQSRRWW
jgi:hypothetical protein